MKAIRSRAPRKVRAARWINLGKGIKVLKLWKTIGPRQPQIAILQLSSERYKAFVRDPKSFVNGFEIFGPRRTRRVVRFRLARLAAKEPDAMYALILNHQMDCTSSAISSEGLVP